jgi:hypothetical protein
MAALYHPARNYSFTNPKPQEAYLVVMEVTGESRKNCIFRGMVCGKPETRKSMALSFINSVGIAIDLS